MSRGNRMSDAEDTRSCSVYRIYDAADRLLYVGCAVDAWDRIHTHAYIFSSTIQASADMCGLMDYWTKADYPDRSAGRVAERSAIEVEHPFFNNHHNKGHRISRNEYLKRHGGGDTLEASEMIARHNWIRDSALNMPELRGEAAA